MEVVINTEILMESQLKAEEFIALYLIWKEEHGLCHEMYPDMDFKSLEKKGFMKRLSDDMTEWVVRDKFKVLVTTDDSHMWYQFCKTMPFKVPNGYGGNRILRAKDPDAGTNLKIKKKYLQIVSGKPALHKTILKCIDIQLREMRHSMQYLQNTDTWLNQRTWEKYEHLINEEHGPRQDSYGAKLI
jgi:hypothetical protein